MFVLGIIAEDLAVVRGVGPVLKRGSVVDGDVPAGFAAVGRYFIGDAAEQAASILGEPAEAGVWIDALVAEGGC